MPNDLQVGPHYEFQIAGQRCRLFEHFGPASYDSTAKETLTARNFSVSEFAAIIVCGASVTDSTSALYGDVRAIKVSKGEGSATWKLIWYSDAAGTETANAVDLSGKRVTLLVIGI